MKQPVPSCETKKPLYRTRVMSPCPRQPLSNQILLGRPFRQSSPLSTLQLSGAQKLSTFLFPPLIVIFYTCLLMAISQTHEKHQSPETRHTFPRIRSLVPSRLCPTHCIIPAPLPRHHTMILETALGLSMSRTSGSMDPQRVQLNRVPGRQRLALRIRRRGTRWKLLLTYT
jgi:hypothetical protein